MRAGNRLRAKAALGRRTLRPVAAALLCALAAAGCARRIVPSADTTRLRLRTEYVRDTVTLAVRDSSLLRALLECDSVGQVRVRELSAENGRLVRQNVSLRGNLLLVRAEGESQQRVRERIVRDTAVLRERVPYAVHDTKEVYKLRGWQRWLLWIGAFYLLRTGVRLALNRNKTSFINLLKQF